MDAATERCAPAVQVRQLQPHVLSQGESAASRDFRVRQGAAVSVYDMRQEVQTEEQLAAARAALSQKPVRGIQGVLCPPECRARVIVRPLVKIFG